MSARTGLTPEERAHFDEHGYVVVRGAIPEADFEGLVADLRSLVEIQARAWTEADLLPAETLDELLQLPFETRLGRIVTAMRSHALATGGDKAAVDGEIQRFGQSLDTMHARTRGTFEFFFGKALLDCIQTLVGGEILLSPIQHLRPYLPMDRTGVPQQRGAGAASLAPWHQDMGVTREEADGTDIVTCWIPLVDANMDMGALRVIPDLHDPAAGKGVGLLEHIKDPTYGTTIRPDLIAPHEAAHVGCPCQRGDLLLMHHFTPHKTGGPNVDESGAVRWSLDVRFQKVGTPTGRPFWPGVVVRSVSDPAREQRDYNEWCRRWESDLRTSVGERWHRVPGDVGGFIGGAASSSDTTTDNR